MTKTGKRHSLRLKGYDYRQPGYYYVTICTHRKKCVLATLEDNQVMLTQLGKIVEKCWQEIPAHFRQADLDTYVIMPNHMHGILQLGGRESELASFQTVITAFKGACTRTWGRNQGRRSGSIWQRDYYERIIRNEIELVRFRQYILQNPIKWHLDELNPLWRF